MAPRDCLARGSAHKSRTSQACHINMAIVTCSIHIRYTGWLLNEKARCVVSVASGHKRSRNHSDRFAIADQLTAVRDDPVAKLDAGQASHSIPECFSEPYVAQVSDLFAAFARATNTA